MGISELQPNNTIDVEGIEIFGSETAIGKDGIGYQHPNLQRQPGLTIKEAAKVLNVSTNTVRAKIRASSIYAYKVKGTNGEEWRVFLDGQPSDQNDPTNTVQVSPSGAEISRFLEIIQKQTEKLEAAAGQIGYLTAQLESRELQLASSQETIKHLTSRQPELNQTWWQKFASWFFLSKQEP